MQDSVFIEKAEKILGKMIDLLGIQAEYKVSIETDDIDRKFLKVLIEGEDLGRLIGYRAKTLNAFQMIFNQVLTRKTGEPFPVLVDINGYRDRRNSELRSLADRATQEVRETGQDVDLLPLSAFERRIVHVALKDIEGIETESEGEGEERHIVVKLRKE